MDNLSVVIMAAGKGTRMKSSLPKVLHVIMGKPMVAHILDRANQLGSNNTVLITGHQHQLVEESVKTLYQKSENLAFALQSEQLGTGHAVMQAMPHIKENSEYVLILSGDTPLLTDQLLQKLVTEHETKEATVTLVSMRLDDATGYGRIIRSADGETLDRIVEHKDATVEERKILEVNAGIYIFRRADLEYSLGQLTNENSQGEFYLTDTIAIINKYEGKVLVMEADDPKSCRGINSRRDLLECQEIMKKRINYRLMDEGVTLYSLENIYVEADCQIGEDTILYPGTIIRGGSQIGSNCRIGPDSLISATRVGNGSAIHYSVVEEADIPPEVAIGPFAHVKG